MDYLVELTQVSSKGTVIFETNFGLAFTADFTELETLYSDKSKKRRIGATRRYRILKLLSPCHGAVYDSKLEAGNTVMRCHVCNAESIFPLEFMDLEYPEFGDKEKNLLQNFATKTGLDTLDAVIAVESLVDLIEDLWSSVKGGTSVRRFLGTHKVATTL